MIQGRVLAEATAQPPKGWGLKQETPISYSYHHVFSKMAVCLRTGAWNVFTLTRKQDAFQKQWSILLTTMISSIYLHQGPTKLGKAPKGTPSNSNSQNCPTFKLNRKMWKGEDIVYLARDRSKQPTPALQKSEVLHLLLSQYFQTASSKRPGPPQPLLSRHTITEMLKQGLVPSRRCYHI